MAVIAAINTYIYIYIYTISRPNKAIGQPWLCIGVGSGNPYEILNVSNTEEHMQAEGTMIISQEKL